jgi:hypothetical protein
MNSSFWTRVISQQGFCAVEIKPSPFTKLSDDAADNPVQNADFSMSIMANPMGLSEQMPRVALNLWPNLLSFVPVLSTRPLPNGSLPGPLILRRRNARFSLSVLGTLLFLGP